MKQVLSAMKLSVAAALLGLLVMVAAPTVVYATPISHFAVVSASKQAACDGAGLSAAECAGTDNGLGNVIKAIVKILSIIVGFVAVIMIIISGLRYVTSGGDAQKVSGAKSALIYALVGIVVVALAQVIVHFVFANAV